METKGNIYFLHRKVDLLSFFMYEMRGGKGKIVQQVAIVKEIQTYKRKKIVSIFHLLSNGVEKYACQVPRVKTISVTIAFSS